MWASDGHFPEEEWLCAPAGASSEFEQAHSTQSAEVPTLRRTRWVGAWAALALAAGGVAVSFRGQLFPGGPLATAEPQEASTLYDALSFHDAFERPSDHWKIADEQWLGPPNWKNSVWYLRNHTLLDEPLSLGEGRGLVIATDDVPCGLPGARCHGARIASGHVTGSAHRLYGDWELRMRPPHSSEGGSAAPDSTWAYFTAGYSNGRFFNETSGREERFWNEVALCFRNDPRGRGLPSQVLSLEWHADGDYGSYAEARDSYRYAYVDLGRNFREAFHTYRVSWRPGLLRWFVDGAEVHRERANLTHPMRTSLIVRPAGREYAGSTVTEYSSFSYTPWVGLDEALPEAAPGGSAGAQRVPLATVETRLAEARLPVPGVAGREFLNVGAGLTWRGWRTKAEAFSKWLNETHVQHPHRIVVLLDYADVMFGGCSDEQLLARYRATVAASGGAPVVAGSELHLFPPSVRKFAHWTKFRARRRSVQQAFGLNDTAYGRFLNQSRCDRDYYEGCSRSWQFLNAGFVMGPVAALQRVFAGMLRLSRAESQNWGHFDDQGAMIAYMFHHPDEVTLDYSGSLIADLPATLDGVVTVDHTVVRNAVTNATQCFVHEPGKACAKVKALTRELAQSSSRKWFC